MQRLKGGRFVQWLYKQPVEIFFKTGGAEQLGEIIHKKGFKRGLLVCDPFMQSSGIASKIQEYSDGILCAVYSGITPNPRVDEVDECAALIRAEKAEFVVALGGGSSLDCAKAACAISNYGESVRAYHSGQKPLPERKVSLIAIPTTAGTGSEVTCVSVLSDPLTGRKAPMAGDSLYPDFVIVDPLLTLTVPPKVTAATGMDVLSHALEGFWSKNHQPICDALALHAARLVFENLLEVFEDGSRISLREKMCEASVIAGLAFALPKTAASHACSFPLTSIYGLPHGEACAFTLGALCRINAQAENGRLNTFARQLGFADADDMADCIERMKKHMDLACTLNDAGIKKQDIPALVEKCKHPNLFNNPVELDDKMLTELFISFCGRE